MVCPGQRQALPGSVQTDYNSGDRGVYIKKLLRCTLFFRNIFCLCPVSMVKRGIYRKIVCLYPADRKKVDLKGHFFYIYPVMWKKSLFEQLQRSCAGYWREIFLYIPWTLLKSDYFTCVWYTCMAEVSFCSTKSNNFCTAA